MPVLPNLGPLETCASPHELTAPYPSLGTERYAARPPPPCYPRLGSCEVVVRSQLGGFCCLHSKAPHLVITPSWATHHVPPTTHCSIRTTHYALRTTDYRHARPTRPSRPSIYYHSLTADTTPRAPTPRVPLSTTPHCLLLSPWRDSRLLTVATPTSKGRVRVRVRVRVRMRVRVRVRIRVRVRVMVRVIG